nr:pectin acetylesterase 8-like [Ipomoea batatas]
MYCCSHLTSAHSAAVMLLRRALLRGREAAAAMGSYGGKRQRLVDLCCVGDGKERSARSAVVCSVMLGRRCAAAVVCSRKREVWTVDCCSQCSVMLHSMATTTFLLLLGFIVILTTPLQAQTPDDIVPISWVKNAIVKGAVCLDGTPAAYYYEQGQGDGANNWLVFLQVTNVTYRGARIFRATMDDLQSRGMNGAQNALLIGSSAGGLAAMIHCDRFRGLLPWFARVKCLPIAAYFVHEYGSAGMLPPQCTSIMTPSHCLFPQYLLEYVVTPVFIAMSSFDQVQIKWNLFKEDEVCLVSQNCTHDRKQAIQELRSDVLAALPKAPPLSRGIWMTSCIAHEMPYYSTLTIIGNKILSKPRYEDSVSVSLVEVDSGYLVWFERFGEITKPENNVGVALGRSELKFGLGA